MHPVELVLKTIRRARFLFRKDDTERDMNDEMRAHLAFDIDDRIKRGLTAEEARRSALVDFGGIERFKEDARVERGVRPLEDFAQDTTYALRVLRKSPGFTFASIATTAVGIAATTAVFSAVNAVLFRPPPVENPDQLFTVSETWKSGQHSFSTDMAQFMYRYASYRELRDVSSSGLSGLAAFRYGSVAVRTDVDVRPISSMAVSPNYFGVLGIKPEVGQLFSDSVEHPGEPLAEVVISHDLWQSDFNGRSDILGTTLVVDGRSVTIVGVAPAGFVGTIIGIASDIWLLTDAGNVTMIGRLQNGLNRKQAMTALSLASAPLPLLDHDPLHKVVNVILDPVTGPPAMTRAPVMGFMGVLLFTAVMVLLIVAANIAGMLLARAAHRRREIAVRLALGASRGRIVRQLLTESIMLCIVGGAVGMLLAVWLLSLLPTLSLPISARVLIDFHADAHVLAVSFAVALAAGVVAGLTPALQSVRVDLISTLRGVQAGIPRTLGRSRGVFVIAQLSLSLVLLVTAGLFMRALQRGLHTDRGFDSENIEVAQINLSAHGYREDRGGPFYEALMAALAARPEIKSAALALWTPLALGSSSEEFLLPDGKRERTLWGIADNHYLSLVHIPVVEGRSFNNSDTPGSLPVAIVNETLARRMWPGQSALGKEIKLNGTRQVVGVMKNGKYASLDEAPTSYAMVPLSQRYSPSMTVHFTPRGDRAAAIAAVRRELASLNPNVALEKIGTLDDQIDIYLLPQRVAAWCIGAFGFIGLGLAVLGIYGVIAYYVVQRTHEFGVRIALGASARDIVSSVVRPGVRVTVIAIGTGIPIAVGVAQFAKSFLYGIGAADPLTLAVVALTLGTVAMVASYVPARRAAQVDPMISLRAE